MKLLGTYLFIYFKGFTPGLHPIAVKLTTILTVIISFTTQSKNLPYKEKKQLLMKLNNLLG